MKKFIACLLVLLTLVSLGACGVKEPTEASTEAPTEAPVVVSDPLTLMNTVWDQVPEDDKFPVIGGDYSEENMNESGPGNYSLDDPAVIETYFGLPEASVAMVDQAASLMHMMNTNSFTAAAFHVAKPEDVSTVVADIQNNLANRHWMCGFPDKLVIVTLGDYVVSFFGLNENVDAFKAGLLSAYSSAVVAVEDNIE